MLLVQRAKESTGSTDLCLGGGCAYNGVANTLAYRSFKSIHIPFAPSDAGSAIGACLTSHSKISPYLGPEFQDHQIKRLLDNYKNRVQVFKLSTDKLIKTTAQLLNAQKIVAWYQGRMEFGARAFGNRSILASPKDPKMREK